MTSVQKERTIYCFDTSAFVTLSRTSENIIEIPPDLWGHLAEMMQEGTLISHKLVFDEISSSSRNPDFVARWVVDKERHFLDVTPDQIKFSQDVVEAFPGLLDTDMEREQADPWLIALAIEKSRERTFFHTNTVVVVSQENPNSSKKIPAACKHFDITHKSLKEFFDEIGLSISVLRNGNK